MKAVLKYPGAEIIGVMRKIELKEIQTEIYIKDFDIMINELLHPRNNYEAKRSLNILQYYLINIVPQYKGIVYEYIENETNHAYSSFLFHMGRLAVFVEMEEYEEAFKSIEDLYVRVAHRKDTFFQPKYVYNILKILSRIGGKTSMMQRWQDEMTFKEMADLVNKKSSEFKYIKKKIRKLPKEIEMVQEAEFQSSLFYRKQEEQFKESMWCIQQMMVFTRKREQDDKVCDKTILIDYLMDIIKNDLKYDCFANVIYRKEQLQFFWGLPKTYIDSDGNVYEVTVKKKAAEVDFSKVLTFSVPWKQRRIPENLLKLSYEKFKYFEGNHQSVYVPQFNMCFAYNGNHTIAIGAENKQGKIISDVIDIEPLFGNVDTDGVYWFSVYDKNWSAACEEYKECNNLGRLTDFRLGLLFKLAEMKHNIKLQENYGIREERTGGRDE